MKTERCTVSNRNGPTKNAWMLRVRTKRRKHTMSGTDISPLHGEWPTSPGNSASSIEDTNTRTITVLRRILRKVDLKNRIKRRTVTRRMHVPCEKSMVHAQNVKLMTGL
ncbi:hypothetical protein V1477_020254 [Vespula maculifrons]|uniref:Uncharacterized protein n=1 Tax=Vespula maculifrons TaxID=7453 RepID=A0ABD2ALE4_VESMC